MPINNTQDICNFECVATNEERDRILNNVKKKNYEIFREPLLELNNSKVYYAPVGNYPDSPSIIICGKTTSDDSKDKFLEILTKTGDIYSACFASPYTNMKENLFIYLWEVDFFKLMKKLNRDYWNFANRNECKKRWGKIFENKEESPKSGIQITQAINCAIINSGHGGPAKQPSLKTVNEFLDKSNNCIFKSFRKTEKLKLIIFLDTPFGPGFHQSNFFVDPDFKSKNISITHPSGQNNVVFNNLPEREWEKMGRKGKNVKFLFETAQKVINDIN